MRAFLCLALLFSSLNTYAALTERRIWIETAIDPIKDEQCDDKQKRWRCLFPDREECQREMKAAFASCAGQVLPDLPEYIDDATNKDTAKSVVVECLTTELTKKHLLGMGKEKMDEYNVCTGAVARSKPLSPALQKALDFSKSQTSYSCADSSFLRKCWNLVESVCKETVEKAQAGCSMRMESEGPKVRDDGASVQEAGRKITDCALAETRKNLDASRKRIRDKDCE